MSDQKTNQQLLPTIHGVEDLRALPDAKMPALAAEIREYLIAHAQSVGGHLASNLGVVELTLALHRVFDTPSDRLIWDVGHQCYVHKMMTGRMDRFDTMRVPGGLSGFTRREESPFDPFGSGHSSTSISAALGFAYADKLRGEEHTNVVVIGDGALTGGLAHEALNNCVKNLPLIIVLNQNEMSISRTTGAFPHLVSRLRISRKYRRMKSRTKRFLNKIPLIGRPLYRFVSGVRNTVRGLLSRSNYFVDMGFVYLGPYDGNDYSSVKHALEAAKEKGCSVIVHLRTKKGKGFPPAEAHPDTYHCLYPNNSNAAVSFHEVFGRELCHMAEQDSRICAITPATGISSGLSMFGEKYPDRLFDVGIAEGHAMTFAAGLSAAGMMPYAVVYSSFLQRGYDQIVHDIALQHLPVHIIIDRASLAPADGVTHHGIYDVSFLSEMPEIRLFAPATFASLCAMLRDTREAAVPVAIRYPNSGEDRVLKRVFYPDGDYEDYSIRTAGDMTENCRVVLVSYGKIASRAWQATEQLRAEGVPTRMLLLQELNPTATVAAAISRLVPPGAVLVFLEEGIYNGGAGMLLTDALTELRPTLRHTVLAIRDPAVAPTAPCDLYEFYGVSAQDAVRAAHALLDEQNGTAL
jgi:1-deoxy-D-xylulose-5-phosphate synthase